MTSFVQFPLLPAELRLKITSDVVDAERDDIIEVYFDRRPTISRTGVGQPWNVVWAYKCYTMNQSPLLGVSQEIRAEYLRTHPDSLRLNRGQFIYFNAEKDTIYFDAESLFNLWHYVKRHRAQFNIPQGNLRGFNLIQTLGHFNAAFPPPEIIDHRGLYESRDPAENVLTGLTNIRLLGSRGIHPGPRPFGTNPATLPVAQQPLAKRLRAATKANIVAFNGSRGFNDEQQGCINFATGRVMFEVMAFVGINNLANLDIPVTVG